MASITQKIQELQRLRQALLDTGMAADEADKKIRMLTSQTLKVSAFGTGQRTETGDPVLNPKSVSRVESRVVSAAQGVGDLKRIETLGNDFRATMNKVVASVIRGLQGDLNEIRGLDWTTLPGNERSRGATPPAQTAAPKTESGLAKYWNDRKAREALDQEMKRKNEESKVSGTTATGMSGAQIQEMRKYIELLRQDWIALGKAPEKFDDIIRRTVGNSVDDLKKLEDAAAKAAQKIAEITTRSGTTGTPPTRPPVGGTNRPQNLQELAADAQKLRKAMEDTKIPLGDFDKIIKAAMDTGDVKVLETELRKLTQNFNDLTNAANKASQATQNVGKVPTNQNLKGPQPPTTVDYGLAEEKALKQSQTSIEKQAAFLPPELHRGARELGDEYIAGYNERVTAVAKLNAEQAILNKTQAEQAKYIDNVSLKTKRLQGNVVELTASFKSQNEVVQKGSKVYKEVDGVWEELANASDKLSIAQKKRIAESAQRGDFDTAELQKQADKYRFNIEDTLRSVETEATTGITRYRLEKPITKLAPDPKTGQMVEQATGAFEKLNVTLDKNGVLLHDTQKRFRSFGDAIVRDIGEVLKWSIAVGLVYGGMQKLSEALQTAIDNQTKLVDITIALGNAQRSTNDIFKDAATIAQASGESISGVLESYTLAYRAAGDISDPIERTAAANKFLSDSLVLSKLSSLDQAAALDTLSGALKQTADLGETTQDMFDRSTFLLDSWVATTKAANVDMATLATAFSITSESAENAGLEIQELNAVIAVMSEKIGALGPKETGNTVRALIGGIYSQKAAQELAKFGVTVQDATGKSRGFLDIMTQLYQLNQKKIIDDDQLNKLALALGGGVRRGQQYLAFITGLGRVNEVVAAQTDVNGQAQAALAMQLETVQTAITRLGNSFQGLSQALGTEGGFLTAAKLTLDTLTKIVEVITQLTNVAGKAGPVLIATLAAASYLGKGTRAQSATEGVGNFFGGVFKNSSKLSGMANKRFGGQPDVPNMYPQMMGQQFGATLSKGAGFIGPGISAGINAAEGDWAGAGSNMAGALLAGLVTGFNPIAMSVGSLIGESFMSTIGGWLDTKERDAAAILIPGTGEQATEAKKTPLQLLQEEKDKQKQALYEQVYEMAGQGDATRGKFRSGLLSGFTGIFGGENLSQQQAAVGIAGGGANLIGPSMLSDEDKAKLEDLVKQIEAIDKSFTRTAENLTERESTNIQELVKDTIGGNDFFAKYAREQSSKALQELTRGEISAKEQRNVVSALPGLPAASLQMYTALGGTADDVGRLAQEITGMASQEDVLRRLMDLLITAPEEATLYIKTLAGDINDLKDAIAEAQETGAPIVFGGQEFTSAASAMALLTEKTEEYTASLKGMYIEQARTSIKIPDVQVFEDATSKQMEEMIANARIEQEKEYKAILPDVSDLKLQEIFAGFEPYFAKTKEDYQEIFALDPKFLQEQYQKAAQAGKLATSNMDFGFFEADKYRVAEQYYSKAAGALGQLGYKEDITPRIVALDDGTVRKTTKDSKIMSLLMSQLVDLSEKQLDGIYNLPTSASFYVPSQAAGMAGGGGGGGGFDLSMLEKLFSDVIGGGETPATTQTALTGQAQAQNWMREEEKRLASQAKVTEQLLIDKEKEKKPVTLSLKDLGLPAGPLFPAKGPEWADEYDMERSRDRNRTRVSEAELSTYYGKTVPRTQEIRNIDETGADYFRNMMDAINNIKVNSQLELKQNITANVSVILNQAQIGRAVAKYLEEQQLIFSANSITKNTVI